MVAAHDSRLRRPFGMSRILEHCDAVSRLIGGEIPAPRARLEHAIGPELAGRLLAALAPRREHRRAA